jgi:hypothetical protein
VTEGPAQKRAAGSAMARGFRKSHGTGSAATGGSGAGIRLWRRNRGEPDRSGGPEGRSGGKGRSGRGARRGRERPGLGLGDNAWGESFGGRAKRKEQPGDGRSRRGCSSPGCLGDTGRGTALHSGRDRGFLRRGLEGAQRPEGPAQKRAAGSVMAKRL